ncbi:insulin receptor substrate 1 [Nephila pilipes]|uniref:Insulin receptor substrate 1 n=1 Tax=Nephila pilipes TaxID=299642 RepID=A0A8X6PB09_NEPPI|nr:insulin receptor substrate 1 [Nephila pilipes]
MSQKYKSFSRSSDRSIDCGLGLPPGVKRMGYLRKLKKMKRRFFVLHMESNYGVARLEYYSSEKKWKFGCEPRRTIELKSCLNISRKLHSKHKNAIAIYTQDDCFSIVTESPEELELWLNDLLEVQRTYMEVDENSRGRPVYEHLWQVVIDRHDLEYDRLLVGHYRVALSSRSLFLIKMNPLNDNDYFEFPLMSIRRCGHSKDHFFIELGRSSVIGAGEIYMATEGTIVAQNMHETVLSAMKSSKIREDGNPFPRPRSASTSENSNPVTTRRPIGYVAPQTVSSSVSSCGLSNSRERCDSLPTRPKTITGNSHNCIHSALSSPYTTSGATFRRLSSRPHSMYEWPSCNSPSARSANFSPGSLSSTSATAYSSSTEDVHNIRHQPLSQYPLPSDGKLSSDRPITEVPDEYLKMSLHEDKKIGHSIKVVSEKSAEKAPKKNDYMDMRVSSVSKSDSVKKHTNFIPVPHNNATGENSSSRDGYLDMSPSNSSKSGLSFHSFPKEVGFNFSQKTDINSKPCELEKIVVKSVPSVKVKEIDYKAINLNALEKKADSNAPIFDVNHASIINSAKTVDTKPPLPERTYRKNEQKSIVCPPLPMRKPEKFSQNSNCLQNRSVLDELQNKQDLTQNVQAENYDLEEQDVFYNSTPSQAKPDMVTSPEQNTNFSCLCSNDKSNIHSLPCASICSATKISSKVKQSTTISKNDLKVSCCNYMHKTSAFSSLKNVCDNSEVQVNNDLKNSTFDNAPSISPSNSQSDNSNCHASSTRTKTGERIINDYVNVEIKKNTASTISNHVSTNYYAPKHGPLLMPGYSDTNDPNYSNIQFGKPICPTPKPIPVDTEAVFSAFNNSLKPDRSFKFSCNAGIEGPSGQKVLRSPTGTLQLGTDSSKCSILAPKFRNIPNTLPTFRKQMSAPAAPLSLRPELPSPGRKSSCPVTGSASMVRPSLPGTSVSPMRGAHLQSHGVPNAHLRVSTSRSPDHSSVSSISSASDEISSTHSSPKASTASQNFGNRPNASDGQYENVVIPQRSSTSSRPPSTSSEEKELNYALLDLTPSVNDEVPRSPTVQKPQVPDDDKTLTYAEIDFTKSEGLKNTSGIVRDGRL